jgi:hypothetical protein
VSAHGPVRKVRCDDGRSYLVVMTPPLPFLRGAGPRDVLRAVGSGLDSSPVIKYEPIR